MAKLKRRFVERFFDIRELPKQVGQSATAGLEILMRLGCFGAVHSLTPNVSDQAVDAYFQFAL